MTKRSEKGSTSATPAANAAAAGTQTKAKTPVVKSAAVLAAEKALRDAKQAERPAKVAKPKPEPQPQCTGTKKDGTKCTARAKTGYTTCIDHLPAWERLTELEQATLTSLMNGDQMPNAQFLVTEIGWHRAKAIVRAIT